MTSCGHFDFAPDDPVARRIGLGAAALRYQRLGLAVLPLQRGGKRPHRMLPLEPGGVHNATHSQLQTDGRWTIDPAANVGVATGKVSNLVVVDLDVKGGINGPAVFGEFLGQHEPADRSWWESVPCAVTPSGGCHLWLRWWDGWDVPERPGILPGVDIKGNGGLVVAPPSMLLHHPSPRPGDQPGENAPVPLPYYWAAGCPCQAPQAPAWLAQWISSAPALGGPAASQPEGETPDISELSRTGIPAGERNSTLYRLACSRYRMAGTDPEASLRVLDELRAVYEAGDKAGMSWHEVLTIAQSARTFIQRQVQAEREMRQSWLAAQGYPEQAQ